MPTRRACSVWIRPLMSIPRCLPKLHQQSPGHRSETPLSASPTNDGRGCQTKPRGRASRFQLSSGDRYANMPIDYQAALV